ncbi:hypothetical protein GCM10010124_40540 [Pilimelia terevasa]|uniref:Uncharacterized protein n=1 Tax=Pilimelia terevasa TaxID=53372 RepID=A0A8J3BS88_9ACTN|nr:hypothetical protein [Pilimelia terevasa]GGK43632.1 hypothetical protein GCM10010124_40540 [Pilimelia terevasa]
MDGSPDPLFAAHRRAFPARVRYRHPDPARRYRNGKVTGVATAPPSPGTRTW